MKIKLITVVLMLFVAVSCKTTKKVVEEKSHVETNVQNDIKKGTLIDFSSSSNAATIVHKEGVESITRESNITKWSPPDSTGKQYVTETMHAKETSIRGDIEDVNRVNSDSIHTSAKDSINNNSKIGIELDDKINVLDLSKDKTHTWTIWGVVTGLLLMAILAYFVLKRYKQV